jgi:hypothetical protein
MATQELTTEKIYVAISEISVTADRYDPKQPEFYLKQPVLTENEAVIEKIKTEGWTPCNLPESPVNIAGYYWQVDPNYYVRFLGNTGVRTAEYLCIFSRWDVLKDCEEPIYAEFEALCK